MADNKTVITPYGYAIITQRLRHCIKVKFSWGGFGFLQHQYLDQQIPLLVKSFRGKRQLFQYSWPIDNTFQSLFQQLAKSLELESTHLIKLLYPQGTLKELKATDTPFSLKLRPHTKLIIAQNSSFVWAPQLKGQNIEISNQGLTVTKQSEDNYQTVLGTSVYSSGKHYWEIKIEKFVRNQDIFIGVALKDVVLNVKAADTGMFWGYLCSGGKKCGPDVYIQDYAEGAGSGDVIGVELEYQGEVGSLGFYKNNQSLGTAFSNVVAGVSPAVNVLCAEASVTLECKYQ